jgi:UDP-N-acetyl-2-amino-2-deoxyglucuronate dehydrogenase
MSNSTAVAVQSPAAASAPETRVREFALIGVAGYIAPKHLKAIRDTGNVLVAATDPHDAVGILDSYFPDAGFFTEIERFDRFLERRRRRADGGPIEYVTICSPNYLHDAHVRLALRVGAHAICEKPLVINPWNLEQLQELEAEYQRRVYTVLQLRLHPAVQTLKQALAAEGNHSRRDICLTYITRRGRWYQHSWKGVEEKSGGLAMNIGIHFFDLLLWLFGRVERNIVHQNSPSRMSGCLELERARVRWFLSVDYNDLPVTVRNEGGFAYRSITIDGQDLDLSAGFTDLHTAVYREILAGGGFGTQDARPSIELVYSVRHSRESPANGLAHPMVRS